MAIEYTCASYVMNISIQLKDRNDGQGTLAATDDQHFQNYAFRRARKNSELFYAKTKPLDHSK